MGAGIYQYSIFLLPGNFVILPKTRSARLNPSGDDRSVGGLWYEDGVGKLRDGHLYQQNKSSARTECPPQRYHGIVKCIFSFNCRILPMHEVNLHCAFHSGSEHSSSIRYLAFPVHSFYGIQHPAIEHVLVITAFFNYVLTCYYRAYRQQRR